MIRAVLSGCYTASAAGVTVDYEGRCRGSPICTLARKLVEAGHDPATILHVYRGDTLCFEPRPLGLWAGQTIEEGDNSHRPARFAKYRPPGPALRTAQSGVGSGGFRGLPDVSRVEVPGDADAALAGEGVP